MKLKKNTLLLGITALIIAGHRSLQPDPGKKIRKHRNGLLQEPPLQ